MRRAIFAAVGAMLVPVQPLLAQAGPPPVVPIEIPSEAGALPLYGEDTPGSSRSEVWSKGGEGSYVVRNVTRPTLTPILPEATKATGAAVIVAPGGGFRMLSMDHEGWSVARAFADRGIAAFVLKYRLLPTPADQAEADAYIAQLIAAGLADPAKPLTLDNPQSTEDGLAALALVRRGAREWNIDPARVGMIGFSAGAIASLQTALGAAPGQGPAFLGYIYGPQAGVEVPATVPPLFDAIAWDDPLFPTTGFPLAEAWHAADRPVELHAYQTGGHGFGLGMPNSTTALMLDQFVAWLAMQGFLTSQDGQ